MMLLLDIFIASVCLESDSKHNLWLWKIPVFGGVGRWGLTWRKEPRV